MSLIEVKNLIFSYDHQNNAIDGISFNMEKGKYYSIIGPNGSGKSTLSKLLMGLLEPNKNSIRIFDIDLNAETIHQIRNRIGIVFQNPDNQFVGTTVRDDFAFGLENRQIPQKDMDEIIEYYAMKVGMFDYLDKTPENLSGGQKQRVAIAGVLAMKPDIIIFDEATAMLDPKGKKEILDLISLMRKENESLTIISITHDIEEAFNSDEIIIIDKGKIILKDKPVSIISSNINLEEHGLDYPFVIKLKETLKEKGLILSSNTLEEMVKEICQ